MNTPKSDRDDLSRPQRGVDGNDSPAQVDVAVQDALGRKLRETYDEVVKEAVPTKFLELLDALKKSDGETPQENGI